ncbi:drug resistance transporter, EmrB/QacA subfamily [Clostridium cavendishii DSM 21758]|uniref:Drug resistance transporter, EmrB/QacA subfamily n=1 Tax=Clostridium cavendishii DSM 21758 TaxID=1121302 RepID=A0A1M6SUJ0_9CLOT|nr:MFS transporter [Clostridium cavendishii]SHK48402.1 drug resistance transporter, EmrB/QacA subfamily [Clostridium cavendishii DSM 21758]
MKKTSKNLMLIVFLLGIFIGAMDTGIVSPARTVIANSLNIASNTSVWMITIYTLAYAVSMPIAGKIADKFGKQKIFTISIIVFAIGSLLCGLSNFYGNFSFLLIARVIQAIGGGGIMPIATAYIGESFPPEKRGTALGMVGAVYGISTTLGPTIGSALLSAVGNSNWGFLFFINLPICLIVVLISSRCKDETITKAPSKMDIKGSISLSILILSLMYGLTNVDFHNFTNSIKSTTVYPYFIVFLILLPIFILIEKKAEDPIMNLNYFKDKNIAITLLLSFIVGCGMMGIVFIPQFGENVLKIKTGSGGYLVTLMAIFSGIAAPLGGKLIDKYSAKFILILGFGSTFIGSLILALVTAKNPTATSLIIALAFMGLGMGFTMGTPLNYLMQIYAPKDETSSAQSTLSLVRSIGVAISPNILVGFLTSSVKDMPSKLMEVIPTVKLPNVPGIPQNINIGQGSISPELLDKFKNADVTTIFDACKDFSNSMINNFIPMLKAKMQGTKLPPHTTVDSLITNWKNDYLAQVDATRISIENTFQSVLNSGFSNLFMAAAIIALIGFIITLLLKGSTKKFSM